MHPLSIVASMKRLLLLVLWLLPAGALWSQAADSLADAAAVAAQKDAEERFKRMAADLQTVMETQEVLRKHQEEFRQRLDRLSDEVRSLKDDQNRASGNYVSRDELRKMIEKMKEQLDEQREADKKLILGNIKDLAKAPVSQPVEPKTTSHRKDKDETADEEPYLYKVKKNDRLADIVAAYNDQYKKQGLPKITIDQVVKANPGLNPNKLIEGRKIRIPVPSKETK
jgi:hypothetical protein